MTPEEMVVGACLLSPDSIRFAATALEPADFYSPKLASLFQAMVHMRKSEEPVEPFTVYQRAIENGVKGLEIAELHRIMESVGSAASVSFYAEQVREASNRRRLIVAAQRLLRDAQDETIQPSDAARAAQDALVDTRSGSRMQTKTLEEILAINEDHDWLIPGLLERGDRLVLTGFEGAGKTTWVRQMVICMAAGIHPVNLNPLKKPLGVLVVDVENTESQWRNATRSMARVTARTGLIDPAPAINVFAGARLDITKDSVIGEIHRLVDIHQPDVLCIGPLYKLVSTGVNNDQEAAPVIAALDSLRERGLVLIIEAHAKKGDSQSSQRDLAPRGSAALMGWPEFGFGLYPEQGTADQPSSKSYIARWRGDRDQGRDWPRYLEKGGPFPWSADTLIPETRRKYYEQR